MHAVLDEAVPVRLAETLRGLGCQVSEFPIGWKGDLDRFLLGRLEAQGFEGLLTCDKNLRFQQNLKGGRITLIVLPAQRFPDLAPLAPAIADAFHRVVEPSLVLIDRHGRFVIESLT